MRFSSLGRYNEIGVYSSLCLCKRASSLYRGLLTSAESTSHTLLAYICIRQRFTLLIKSKLSIGTLQAKSRIKISSAFCGPGMGPKHLHYRVDVSFSDPFIYLCSYMMIIILNDHFHIYRTIVVLGLALDHPQVSSII